MNAPVSRLLPCGIAFLASGAIMAVEMAAGRMMAMYQGAGLYTWTSVIGVVLLGITIGNVVGGFLAERFRSRPLLGVLLFLAASVCLALPLLQYWMGRAMGWDSYSQWGYRLRVATHVAGVFFVPAMVLGTLGPAIAKLALERGANRGRTVGDVYACGTLGSIVGTFLSGYLLIGVLGTAGVVLGVAGVLAVSAWLLAPRQTIQLLAVTWPLLVGILWGSLLVEGRGPGRWHWLGDRVGVMERVADEIIYSRETQYSFVRISESRADKQRKLYMDNLIHAVYSPEKPKELLYDYERIYDVLTERHGRSRPQLNCFFIGGGGYIFPRHIRQGWPESTMEIAEIDPLVTAANFEAFGLRRDEVEIRQSGVALAQAPAAGAGPRPMAVYHLDARNHLDDLLRRQREGKNFKPFDFVYGDAFNDYCVPSHLVTRECMQKVRDILVPERGIYLMNVIDIFDSSRFLGAMYNTLNAVFPHVYVFSDRSTGPAPEKNARATWILAASLRPLDVLELGKRPGEEKFTGSLLNEEHIALLKVRSRGVVLTDDYAPVENLLDNVVRLRMTVTRTQ